MHDFPWQTSEVIKRNHPELQLEVRWVPGQSPPTSKRAAHARPPGAPLKSLPVSRRKHLLKKGYKTALARLRWIDPSVPYPTFASKLPCRDATPPTYRTRTIQQTSSPNEQDRLSGVPALGPHCPTRDESQD
ncbi:hypothetical protein A0H81_04270 [Grifola frondosa]|uniref:Uncharacterized protein n=1 Tax=Grifola frondosa TaxID=5627 RepID=A0A1C7MEZ9_GRIFR|nr:hypothetical protein A0H81_04270 [Grifola frondosa]